MDISLPKGSTSIHLYVVLGVSSSKIQSQWPTTADNLIAVAAPQVMVPVAPTIEAKVSLDAVQPNNPPVYQVHIDIDGIRSNHK